MTSLSWLYLPTAFLLGIAHTCVILLLAMGVLALGNAFPIEREQPGLNDEYEL